MEKVFGIGFHKTGTTTLEAALEILGYQVCGARTELAQDLAAGNMTKVFELVDAYDAFQDNPWPLLYRELDERYPGSKFIVTYRDEEKWLKSVVNHFGEAHTDMRAWIYGHGAPKGNEATYLARYKQHLAEVKTYFKGRPEDLLIVSWADGDGWEKLCAFLNKDIPTVAFPHVNRGRYTKTSKFFRRVYLKLQKWKREFGKKSS